MLLYLIYVRYQKHDERRQAASVKCPSQGQSEDKLRNSEIRKGIYQSYLISCYESTIYCYLYLLASVHDGQRAAKKQTHKQTMKFPGLKGKRTDCNITVLMYYQKLMFTLTTERLKTITNMPH